MVMRRMETRFINSKHNSGVNNMDMRGITICALSFAFLAAPAGKVSANDEGFIYGRITARDGSSCTGTMRWGTQECFWDDLFNAEKDDNPWIKKCLINIKKPETSTDIRY